MIPRGGEGNYAGPRIQTRFGTRPALYMPSVPKLAGGKRGDYIFERHHVAAGDLPEHSFDGHMMLLRIRSDGSTLQSYEVQRINGFLPFVFRWLGDRYAVSVGGGTDVVSCLP